MRFPRNRQIFRGQPDLGAYIGVFFLLLIFILLHSALVFTPGVPIRLPDAEELPGVAGDVLVVAVDASGQFYYDHQVTPERLLQQQLTAAVNASRQPLTLIVEADRDVKWDTLLRLSLLARKAGIKNMFPATRPLETGKPEQEATSPDE
jgi:biopolymer transport protein ExbD